MSITSIAPIVVIFSVSVRRLLHSIAIGMSPSKIAFPDGDVFNAINAVILASFAAGGGDFGFCFGGTTCGIPVDGPASPVPCESGLANIVVLEKSYNQWFVQEKTLVHGG